MSLTNMDALFRPASVAVLGQFERSHGPGSIVMRNLLGGNFQGPVMPVTGKTRAVGGVLTYKSVADLPMAPDLAVLSEPAHRVPELIHQLGECKTRAAILTGPGFSGLSRDDARDIEKKVLDAAEQYDMRLLGPGCLGLIVPGTNLNASLAQTDALPGRTAFITQSDSLFTTVLDWAKANSIGFSAFISLGEQYDVDFASVLDYLGDDPQTRSILLYVESIRQARRFMSAARASARNKPILVLKPDEIVTTILPEESCVLSLDTDTDAVYDVAFRRAGMVRVNDIDSLFDGARTLARSQTTHSGGLAVLTNGRSVGLLAGDVCLKGGAELACFSPETSAALEEAVGRAGVGDNPVVMPFDADGEMYSKALKVLIKDPGVSAVLVIHVPFAGVPGSQAAQAVADVARKTKRIVLTCWLGSDTSREAKEVFAGASVPNFETPDKAIHAFLHMVTYRRNQELLLETPDSLPTDFFPDTNKAREVIEKALGAGKTMLTEAESKDALAAYGVPIVETRVVTSAREAVIAADELGYPIALKIRSPQIRQPFEVGGIALDLSTPEQVWDTATLMPARVHKHAPDAHITGFTVQQMGRRVGAHELYISAFTDPVFGPAIRFGHGGMSVSVIRDYAVALPPLNMSLSQDLIDRTRISRLLYGTVNQKPVDTDAVCQVLIQISQFISDLPQVAALEINPLYANHSGVLGLSARVWVQDVKGEGPARLAIRPYPSELEECVTLKDGTRVTLRPIRPEDAPAHLEFIRHLSDDDLRLRFFGVVSRFEFSDMPKFTQIDYDREMAFIAQMEQRGEPVTLGVVRTSTKPDNSSAEFAIIVRSDMKGNGLGSMLFEKMIRYTKVRGTEVIKGETLPENKGMIGLSKKFGFEIKVDYEDDLVTMTLPLVTT